MKTKLKMLSVWRSICLLIAIVLGLSIVGYALLVVAYCLPVSVQQKHMEKAAVYLNHEGSYTRSMKEANSQQDNFTDALMLLTATYSNVESPWKEALKNTRCVKPGEESPCQTLVDIYQNHSTEGIQAGRYYRYWHGYLIWLKPLLCLFDYPTIRSVAMFVQTGLFVLLMLTISKKHPSLLLPTFLVWVFINPVTTALSLQFYSNTVLMLCGLLFVLTFSERWMGKLFKWECFFAIIGCLTSYFDLLSFPLITLGVPLVLWLFLNRKETLKENIGNIVAISLAWGLGYGLFWAIKWLLGTMILKKNVFSDAIHQAQYRASSSNKGRHLSWLWVMKKQFLASWQYSWAGAFVVMAMAAILRIIKTRRLHLDQLIAFAFVACFPLVWFFILRNHSSIHYWFTFRILAISLYAVGAYIAVLFDKRSQEYIPVSAAKE